MEIGRELLIKHYLSVDVPSFSKGFHGNLTLKYLMNLIALSFPNYPKVNGVKNAVNKRVRTVFF